MLSLRLGGAVSEQLAEGGKADSLSVAVVRRLGHHLRAETVSKRTQTRSDRPTSAK